MNRRKFMMGLFGIAGTAVCVGKAIASDATTNFDPAQFKGIGGTLSKTLKDIEAAQKRLNEQMRHARPGDVLAIGGCG